MHLGIILKKVFTKKTCTDILMFCKPRSCKVMHGCCLFAISVSFNLFLWQMLLFGHYPYNPFIMILSCLVSLVICKEGPPKKSHAIEVVEVQTLGGGGFELSCWTSHSDDDVAAASVGKGANKDLNDWTLLQCQAVQAASGIHSRPLQHNPSRLPPIVGDDCSIGQLTPTAFLRLLPDCQL